MITRKIPDQIYDEDTKNKILNTATEFFALKGYDAVSMRDIAKVVGITMGSIYYYYNSKEALFEDIMSRFETGYRNYFDWLTDVNTKAETLEEFLDNLFNREFLQIVDPIGRFGISLVLKTQHSNETARKHFFQLILKHSIARLQADFDRFVKKGEIPESDTKMIATLHMFSVLMMNEIRVHEHSGLKLPLDCKKIYNGMRKTLMKALKTGD